MTQKARPTRGFATLIARLLSASAASLLIAVPVSAAAASKTVTVQVGSTPSAKLRLGLWQSDVNAFFPSALSVYTGDSVRFLPSQPRAFSLAGPVSLPRQDLKVGFHTVDLPPRGGRPLPLVIPSGSKANSTDASGSRFWFRGFDAFILNPKIRAQVPEGTRLYGGSKRLNSGLPFVNRRKPMVIRFTKVGTYRFFCNLHPGMKGTVRVLRRRDRASTTVELRRASARQVNVASSTARMLVRKPKVRGIVSVGQAGRGGVQRYAFAPAAMSVPRGRTVKFVVPPGSRETHTVATGPGNPATEGDSYLGMLARSIKSGQPDPAATYPSDPPTLGTIALTPARHGNGFWNSGVMDAITRSAPPAVSAVRFRKAGTYRFYCLIHPFMRLKVVVR